MENIEITKEFIKNIASEYEKKKIFILCANYLHRFGISFPDERKKQPVEIERKYRLNEPAVFLKSLDGKHIGDVLEPEVVWLGKTDLKQGYIRKGDVEVRIRKSAEKYFYFTVKCGLGIVREENEVSIPKETFDLLWIYSEGSRIGKNRYDIEYRTQKFEVDQYYLCKEKDLITFDLELENENQVIQLPSLFIQAKATDISGSKSLSNQNLSL